MAVRRHPFAIAAMLAAATSAAFAQTTDAPQAVNTDPQTLTGPGLTFVEATVTGNDVSLVSIPQVIQIGEILYDPAKGTIQFPSSPSTPWLNVGGTITTSSPITVAPDGSSLITGSGIYGQTSPPMFDFTIVTQTALPEPGTWALMGLGLVGIGLARRRR